MHLWLSKFLVVQNFEYVNWTTLLSWYEWSPLRLVATYSGLISPSTPRHVNNRNPVRDELRLIKPPWLSDDCGQEKQAISEAAHCVKIAIMAGYIGLYQRIIRLGWCLTSLLFCGRWCSRYHGVPLVFVIFYVGYHQFRTAPEVNGIQLTRKSPIKWHAIEEVSLICRELAACRKIRIWHAF